MAAAWREPGVPFRHGETCGRSYAIDCWYCGGRTASECRICEGQGGLVFNRCASCLSEPWVGAALRMYRHAQKGYMPAAGGVLDQTHLWLLLFEFIDGLQRHHEAKYHERQSNKSRTRIG